METHVLQVCFNYTQW